MLKGKSSLTLFAALTALLATIPSASAGIIFQNALPTTNLNGYPVTGGRSNVAPVYGSLQDFNLDGGPVAPFILGDQFQLLTPSIINSVTVYEVGNVPVGGGTDATATQFSDVSLFIGPDNSALGLGPAVATLSGSALASAASLVQYTGGLDYQSINSSTFYRIHAITFSGLNIALDAGLYDFAIGATPIGNNSFSLLMSDPSQGSREDSLGITPHGFLYFFNDAPDGSPLATYQYASGSNLVSGWPNEGALDVNVSIQGSSVPEPATFGFVALALGGVLLARKSGFSMLK
jgi:hypothetical protein